MAKPPKPAPTILLLAVIIILTLPGAPEARTRPPLEDLAGLPLIEVPSQTPGGDWLAVYLTGDGGWGMTDKGLSAELAKHGIPVVALNSLNYFWTGRTPEGASQDLARILNWYIKTWGKDRVILIGYSLGADTLPFMYNRLPAELQEKIVSVVLLGPGQKVEFKFHLADWLGRSPGKRALPVLPEVEKISKAEIICVYGEDDEGNICREIDPKVVHVKVISLPTGHRLGRNYGPVAQAILGELKKG